MPDGPGSGLSRWALVAAGPVLPILGALPAGMLVAPRLVAGALLVFILPGLALSLILSRTRALRERAVEAFVLSLAAIGAIGLLGRLAGAGPGAALAALGGLSSALALAIARRGASNGPGPAPVATRVEQPPPALKPGRPPAAPGGRLFGAGLLLIAGAVAAVMGIEGGTFGLFHDSIDHIASVREILESGDLFPATAFYPPVAGDRSIDTRKGFFHLGLALWSRASGADPVTVWRWAPVLTAFMAVLAFGALARRLLSDDLSALLAVGLFALFHGGPGRQWLQISPYGTNLAQVIFWFGTATALDGLRGAPRSSIGLSLIAFAAASVHLTAVVLLFSALAAIGLGALIARGPSSRLLARAAKLGTACLAGALPLLAFRLALGYPASNPIHTHLQGVATLAPSLYIVRPDIVLGILGWTGLLAIPLSLFWFGRARRDDAALYIVSATWFAVFLALNPWVTPIVGKALGYLVVRLTAVIPGAVVIAGVVAWCYGKIGPGGAGRGAGRGAAARIAALAVLVLIAAASRADLRAVRAVRAPRTEARDAPSSRAWEPALRRLDREIADPSVILSDPVTSYCIPAYSRHHVVSALNQHTSPTDAQAVQRARHLETMLNPYVPWERRLPLFEKHGVRYVLLNATFREPLHHFYCNIVPALIPDIRRSLLEARGPSGTPRFEIVSEGDGFLLLRLDDPAPGGGGGEIANPYLEESLPADAVAVGETMEGSVQLVAVRIGAGEARAGGDFPMECWFARMPGPLAPFPYQVSVRCETGYPKGALYRPAWAKPYRRIVQARRGEVYRFRYQHAPCEGAYPPPDWPVGALVADRFTVNVAGGTAAGEYTVRVIVRAPPLLENFALEDYFSDDDYFTGIAVGRLRVTR